MYPGRRVGAILSLRGNTVRFLGYGVYEGDFLPDGMSIPSFDELQVALDGCVPFDEAQLRSLYAAHFGEHGFMYKVRLQPRLRLDNGDIVWGGECHWDDDVTIHKVLDGKDVLMVRLRRNCAGAVEEIIDGVDQ